MTDNSLTAYRERRKQNVTVVIARVAFTNDTYSIPVMFFCCFFSFFFFLFFFLRWQNESFLFFFPYATRFQFGRRCIGKCWYTLVAYIVRSFPIWKKMRRLVCV